jgi:hypothetical protein
LDFKLFLFFISFLTSISTPILFAAEGWSPTPERISSSAFFHRMDERRPFLKQYVMGPLEIVQDWQSFESQLRTLKQLGVDGITTDVWWGLVERERGKFDWSYYRRYAQAVRSVGLRWVPIFSFHKAGGNVGDTVDIPIPNWVWQLEADMAFVGSDGTANREYISFWVKGAYDLYHSVMQSFANHFLDYQQIIDKVYVGAGPAGELRYPSYQLSNGWQYPEFGKFQIHSERAKRSFRNFVLQKYGDLLSINRTYGWHLPTIEALGPPRHEHYFLHHEVRTPYGRDVLEWQQFVLEEHAFELLSRARRVFLPFGPISEYEQSIIDTRHSGALATFYGRSFSEGFLKAGFRDSSAPTDAQIYWKTRSIFDRKQIAETDLSPQRSDFLQNGASLGLKLAGIHWQQVNPQTPRAAAQLAGYHRYADLMAVARVLGASVTFTCMEMRNSQAGYPWYSTPRDLVQEIADLARFMDLPLYGENALSLGNWEEGYAAVRETFSLAEVHGFTLLRIQDLVDAAGARKPGADFYQQRILQRLPTEFRVAADWTEATLERHGLQLRIVGQGEDLGNWNPSFGFPLSRGFLGTWTGTVPVNDPHRVEWMPVIFHVATGRWMQVGPVFPVGERNPNRWPTGVLNGYSDGLSCANQILERVNKTQ